MSHTSYRSYVKITLFAVGVLGLLVLPGSAFAAGIGEVCNATAPCDTGLRCATDGKCVGGTGATVGQVCGVGQPPCAEGLTCVGARGAGICQRPAPTETAGESRGIIVPCALNKPGEGYCDDVNDLLLQLITIGKEAFKYIGALAFFFFIYGGLTIVLSFGSPEKVKKGHGVLVAAVIGLLIAFSAYILIDFVLDALGVVEEFRGVQ